MDQNSTGTIKQPAAAETAGLHRESANTVSDILLDQLSSWGVNRVFGMAGDTILHLLGRLGAHPNIKFYSTKTEIGAAFMASAHSKLTGQLGVCIATAGPGLAQLLNGLGDASLDRTPVLAITGQVETQYIGLDYKQYVDQQALISPLAGYSALVTAPNRLPELMAKAMRTAIMQQTVAHLSIPKDLFPRPARTRVIPPTPYLTSPRSPADAVINGALTLMEKATNPVIIAGGGIANAAHYVVELADKWKAAIVTSMTAKGRISQAHPLVLGGYGQAGSQAAHDAICKSDVCLLLGSTYWPELFMPTEKTIIQVDDYPANIGAGHPVSYGIVGTLSDVLPRLIMGITARGESLWTEDIRKMKLAWESQIAKERDGADKEITPAFLLGRLQQMVPDETVIAVDTGDHTLWFDRVYARMHRLLISGTWRSSGFALPAANAAALADGSQPVIVITGDAGMAMSQAELLTSVRYQLPVKVVVMNNGCMAIEKNRMAAEGLDSNEVDVTNPDFARLAEACGAKGIRVTKPSHLVSSLQSALSHPGPAVVDVVVANVPLPHTKLYR